MEANPTYRVAFYDHADWSLQLSRALYMTTALPEVGATFLVLPSIHVYRGTWEDMISGRLVMVLSEVTHQEHDPLWFLRRGNDDLRHYYVQIADPRERLAAEKLRRLYINLRGGAEGILHLFKDMIPLGYAGQLHIKELMEALNNAGYPPRLVLEWYRMRGDYKPGWLESYLRSE